MSIEDFLKPYHTTVKATCLHLRKMTHELLPDAEEILFESRKNISYGTNESH